MNKKHFLFHLGHPAHYHVFKNIIKNFLDKGHKISIIIKKKDVLEQLLKNENLPYTNFLPRGRYNGKLGILLSIIITDFKLLVYCLKHKPDLLIGSSYAISHVGRLINIPSINVNEDDFDVISIYSKVSFPLSNIIITPNVCRMGKWDFKTVKYDGNHELAYLHPKNFTPNKNIANKYVNTNESYFLIRFAQLQAYHDTGINGISNNVARRLVDILSSYGKIYISAEKQLDKDLEHYRLTINPLDIHHVMSYALMFIGDSQTMAAEAGVLGIPFIRYNDFVGKIGYLKELENTYRLGYGFTTEQKEEMYIKIKELLEIKNLKDQWQKKRITFINDKINVANFLIWFIENYPESKFMLNINPSFQNNFK